ncbi:MAG TPA: ABC transporter ATP-binding protein [Thermodesulfobacteriota bacterium]|nr:ABC transporter ATP-binding protein [Thermodesulfobacteriota bacterium]
MILRFEGVSYRYPAAEAWTLQELTLNIYQGQGVLLAGSSGSGKSTFCRACIGLIPNFHGGEFIGQVFTDGLDTRQHPVYRLFSHAGLVFQNPDAQLFNQTVEAELAYGLESVGLASAEIEKRLAWASESAGLGPFLSRPPYTLSGGEKQRVALGAILALRPRLLLFDEPFTHLDPEGAEFLRRILRTIQAEEITVIVVEHRLHEVIADFDRLVVLHEGQVAADGPPRQVLSHDVSKYGLSLPPLVRLFQASGWKGIPLTREEALYGLKNQNLTDKTASIRNLTSPPFSKGRKRGFENKDSVVEMDDVWFKYDDSPTLRGINLTLNQGECVAFVGRNGAGKTTLVKHLNGLLKPKKGAVKILGRNTLKTPVAELARHVGFAWQNPNDQLFQANVLDEVLTGPRALGVHDSAWYNELFERFELGPLLERSPFQLSEGQKKRVSFAAALAVQPGLVVLDEPTAGQDESFRRELGRLIIELRAEERTVVLVTHDLEFAAEHASRWIALADGQVVADGPPEEVMADETAMKRAGLRPTQRFQLIQAIKQEKGLAQSA